MESVLFEVLIVSSYLAVTLKVTCHDPEGHNSLIYKTDG
jgi:hypothetical protein